MFEINLEDQRLREFMTKLESELPARVADFELELNKVLAIAIQGDILEAVEVYHPYHEFMAARTKVTAYLEGGRLLIDVVGRPEGELASMDEADSSTRRPGTESTTNLWDLHEFGGSTGSASSSKPMPIIKEAGQAPVKWVYSTGERELSGKTVGAVGNIIRGLTAQFKVTVTDVIESLKAEYQGYIYSLQDSVIHEWEIQHHVEPDQIITSGVSLGARKIIRKDNTTVMQVLARDTSTGRFVSLGKDKKMTVAIVQ